MTQQWLADNRLDGLGQILGRVHFGLQHGSARFTGRNTFLPDAWVPPQK